MTDKLLFTCRVCGCDVDGHPVVDGPNGEEVGQQGICPVHCEDHDYEYDPYAGERFCKHCGDLAEWEPDEDFGGVGFSDGPSSAPLGTPASAMNGNAAKRHENPGAWDRWVAFCNSWGME